MRGPSDAAAAWRSARSSHGSRVARSASLGPRTALLLLHAEGDEQVPYTISQELFEAAAEPKRLLVMPGGHHRSIQHDLELQTEALRFVERAASGR